MSGHPELCAMLFTLFTRLIAIQQWQSQHFHWTHVECCVPALDFANWRAAASSIVSTLHHSPFELQNRVHRA